LADEQFFPSYPSAKALLEDVLSDPQQTKDIMSIRTGTFETQLKEIVAKLPEWKAERPHGPKAVLSDHDNAAMTSESRPLILCLRSKR
jgi:proteasome activator subunit 4